MKHSISYALFSESDAKSVQHLFLEKEVELNKYIDLLMWWNKKVNLVSRSVSRETMVEHVKHSLVISQSSIFKRAKGILDAGTGGGLPGIPLAISSGDKRVVLNDVVAKKVLVCKDIIHKMGLPNTTVITDSIENIQVEAGAVIVSKHAFKINELYAMIRKKPWQHILLLKGIREVGAELEGVDEKLEIEIRDLESAFDSDFYTGKALIEITRRTG